MGFWVIGAVAEDVVEEARCRFPDAASAHGTWPDSSTDMNRRREWFEPSGAVLLAGGLGDGGRPEAISMRISCMTK